MGSFDFSSKSAMERKNLDLGRIDALTKFIHRKPRVKAEDEEMGAYLYLRREAIETLAQAAAPAVNAHKKTPQVEGPIATTLLKALVPGAMTPPSTLAERNEAALGLCHVRGVDEYAAAPTIHYVAKTLLELGQSYNRDRANPKAPAEFPWKITAKRWEIALGNLSDTAKGPASRDPSALKLATDLKSMGIRDVTDRISKNVESGVETNKALAPFVLKSRPREETLKLFRTVAGPEIRQPALDE